MSKIIDISHCAICRYDTKSTSKEEEVQSAYTNVRSCCPPKTVPGTVDNTNV